MKKILLFSTLLLTFILSACGDSGLNKVVATVDDTDVLQKNVIYYLTEDGDEKTILEDLVLRELILIEASKEDISVSEAELKELTRINEQSIKNDKNHKKSLEEQAAKLDLSLEEFLNTIWLDEVKKNLIVSKYMSEKVEIVLKDGTPEEYQKQIKEEHKRLEDKLLEKYKDKVTYYNK